MIAIINHVLLLTIILLLPLLPFISIYLKMPDLFKIYSVIVAKIYYYYFYQFCWNGKDRIFEEMTASTTY